MQNAPAVVGPENDTIILATYFKEMVDSIFFCKEMCVMIKLRSKT